MILPALPALPTQVPRPSLGGRPQLVLWVDRDPRPTGPLDACISPCVMRLPLIIISII